MFNLADYETVDSRIHQFYGEFKDGRIVTELELIDMEKGLCVFKAYVYKDSVRTMPDATGYADGSRKDRGVDAQFWINNAETSSIGRALANLGLSAKGKRASAEEMAQVNAVKNVATKVVTPSAPKPAVQDVKPEEQDYWTTPVNDYMKVVDAPVTLEKALENVAAIIGTAEAGEVPTCQHGTRLWKTGKSAKNGKEWANYSCPLLGHAGMEGKCEPIWYEVNSAGKWQPQKGWA